MSTLPDGFAEPAEPWTPSANDTQPAAPVEPKNPAKSKTVWAGACVIAMSGIGLLQGQQWVQDHPTVTCLLGSTVGLLMIGFRFLTNQPLQPPNIIVRRP